MSLILFLSALFFGMLAARAGTVFARGGIQPTNLLVVIINFASMISTIAIVVFGFLSLSWWIPISGFIGISLIAGVLINYSTMTFFYKALPITGLIAIIINAYAWMLYTNV
jgi:hypothetical protein